MPTLTSPGVSVTVTDESFFIPSTAPTVPLLIIATAENKLQPDGVSAALGTLEHDVVRTVTSINQSTQLYGIPSFLETISGDAQHGDARNEYGLLALNSFLGVGNRAYVVRANVNLNDNRADILALWISRMTAACNDLEVAAQSFIDQYNTANGYVNINPLYKVTVTRTELLALIDEVTLPVYESYNFSSTIFKTDFVNNKNPLLGGGTPLDIYNTAYTAIVGQFMGVQGHALDWEANDLGSVVGFLDQWTPAEANSFLLDATDDFAYTLQFLDSTSLGANDAARRSAIVTALQATANAEELRAEAYEYNLVLCPGYFEICDELVALAADISDECMVIGDTPMNKNPDDVVTWAVSSSQGRVYANNIAYYYSNGYMSNLDGKNVLGASSGVALRTIANSDNESQVWFAPAGTQRGVVTGVSQMGYFTGTAGSATTFVEAVLNVGMRDNLYKDGTNVNPITFMPGRGIVVMGQKTSASVPSALDRVNVCRLLAYIKRALRKNTFPFVFEPNDQLTRDNLKAVVDGFLADIVVKRGLTDFATQCDASNNTPDRIDRSEMWCDIAIKPTKAAEFLYIPIRVVATGADI
jgi:hypothetical protein